MRFRSTLIKLAKESTHHRYRHAAIIAKGKQVYGAGVNHIRGLRYVHAEEAAAPAHVNLGGTTLYTLMIRNDGSIGDGTPCENCMRAIQTAGIRRVIVYTS